MSQYSRYSLTPPIAERINPSCAHHAEYGQDHVRLMRDLLLDGSIREWGGYRLWGLPEGETLQFGNWVLLEQVCHPEAVMYADAPDSWRTPAGQALVEHCINHAWGLEQYLAFMNWRCAPGRPELAANPDHWAEYGVTTAPQLADYLQGCHTRNMEKSERYG